MNIRPEKQTDIPHIRAVNLAAFESDAEAKLVDRLRESDVDLISLVAVENETVIGHILFSPVSLEDDTDLRIMGLAPMAVLPDRQNRGVGEELVKAGLEKCEETGINAVVVLGHPGYYPRFGFQPSCDFGIECDYDVPPEVFMIKELKRNSLAGKGGTVSYHPLFNEL